MKRLLALALACALAMPLAGCQTIAKIVPAVGTHAVATSTLDDRALAEAEAAYNVVIHAYNVARRGGHVPVAFHQTRVRPMIVKAHAARKAAEAAYDLGNASDLASQLAAFKEVTAQIKTLTP